jgi:hypothetical protein
MTKKNILKKKETKFFKKLNEEFGEITEDNIDTYPIGNPYAKLTKLSTKEISKMRAELDANRTEDEKKVREEMLDKFKQEYKKEKLKELKLHVRKLFFK